MFTTKKLFTTLGILLMLEIAILLAASFAIAEDNPTVLTHTPIATVEPTKRPPEASNTNVPSHSDVLRPEGSVTFPYSMPVHSDPFDIAEENSAMDNGSALHGPTPAHSDTADVVDTTEEVVPAKSNTTDVVCWALYGVALIILVGAIGHTIFGKRARF